MVNLLNSPVMEGLMSAANSAKLNQFCTGLYEVAKAKGDLTAAENALGYANDFRGKAMDAAEQTGDALARRSQEARQEQQAVPAAPGDQAAVAGAPQPAAVFEPSRAYLDGARASAAPAARPAGAAEAPAIEAAAGRHSFFMDIRA